MRKLVTVFAALAVAGMAMAQAESQIVGYVTKATIANKMDILGVPFQNVGETTVNIQDIIPGTGIDVWGGDVLRVWDSLLGTYTYAYYFGETYNADYSLELGAGWSDGDQIRSDVEIAAGQGFVLTTAANASVIVKGEVLTADDNKLSTVQNKMDILCNTFPTDINIQDIAPVSGIDIWGGDVLRVWDSDAATYTYAYYFGETYNSDYSVELGAGWSDGDQIRLDIPIAAGQGFVLTTASDAVVSFPVPTGI